MSQWNKMISQINNMSKENLNIEEVKQLASDLKSWKKENRSDENQSTKIEKLEQLVSDLTIEKETDNLKVQFRDMKGNNGSFEDFIKIAGTDTENWKEIFKKYPNFQESTDINSDKTYSNINDFPKKEDKKVEETKTIETASGKTSSYQG